jgi:molybdopterin-guanine dinucleotide biosynthesis protein A
MEIKNSHNISGAILAGGANTRFGGRTKANIVIGGSTIMSGIIKIISDIFDEIIIVTNTAEEFKEYENYKIIGDQFLKIGPLGGLHAALKASSKDAVFVFACDMPFIDGGMIINQIENYKNFCPEVLIPQINIHNEPLHAIYNKSILGKLEDYLVNRRDYAIREFLLTVNVSYLQISESVKAKRAFTNINSPSELNDLEKLSGSR